jgi:radical SAM superfamily enzyme YgiQ (UPF0313 family)
MSKAIFVGNNVKRICDDEIWLADLTYTQQTVAADTMPNAIGCIATYLEERVQLAEPVKLFKYPEKLVSELEKGKFPRVIGFSNYVWNLKLSYGFAEVIKNQHPETIVVFGGPNFPTIPADQEIFLRSHPAIDFYVMKEGELAFMRLVESLINSDFDIEKVKKELIPSMQSISKDGGAQFSSTIERIMDLTEIPSPYLSGHLDEFFDGVLLPILQTNRGCPFFCTFCVEGVEYYNKVGKSAAEKVSEELNYIGSKMVRVREKGGRNDLFIADSNFGMFKEDLDTGKALAKTQKDFGWPEYINVATGKNNKERVLKVAETVNGAMRLSGSVQSLDPQVLENIKRKNIDAKGLFELGLAAGNAGTNTYSEIILALPGDSFSAHMNAIETAVNAGFNNIFLFQLMLLPGTEMATGESKRQYEMDGRYRILPRCYGHFDVSGEKIVAAEIEEICVANKTLSFDDYLKARYFHLIVTIFYNDGIFLSLVKLLRSLDIPVFDWIELLSRTSLPDGLSKLFKSFIQEGKDELWDSREELEAFVQQEGIIEKYIAGDIGKNLLFVYKTKAIVSHLDGLAELASKTIKQYISSKDSLTKTIEEFIDDSITYHRLSGSNLFFNRKENPNANLRYNIDEFLQKSELGLPAFKFSAPIKFVFKLGIEREELIERYLHLYGNSDVGIGRILSKVYVRKLFRRAMPADGMEIAENKNSAKESMNIAGLQN